MQFVGKNQHKKRVTAGGGNKPPANSLKSGFFSIMDSSFSVARVCGVSIFDIMERDAEAVIFVINYIIEKGSDAETSNTKNTGTGSRDSYIDKKGIKHVRVDMNTSTGGWY